MRKKTLFCFSSIGILVSLALIASSCEREPITPDLLERQINVQINGVLNFDSFEDFSKTAMLLNALTFQELEQWCNERSFVSQEYLFQKLIREEETYENDIIEQYGENVTPDYLTSELNLPEHSSFYFELLSKGIIKEILEEDGSKSYETTVINPVYMSVINENGLAIINNEIYQYTETGFKIIHDGNPEKIIKLPDIEKSNSELGITVVKLTSVLKGYGHTFDRFLQKTESSRKRASFKAYFYMGENGVYYDPATCMSPSFYIECKGQKKNIWGNWVYKNNYLPITEVSGSWTYRFKIVEIGNPFNYQYIYSVNDPNSIASPLFYTYFNGMGNSTNYFKATCVPDGDWFCAPSGWLMDECSVYDYNFRMKAANYSDFVFTD